MTLEPGRHLAHYRIERLLGQGGMGEVYLAEDTKLDRQVALKILPQEMAASAERLERFRREAKAVAALNHPHIVTIYSVEDADGIVFLTMELLEGKTLSSLIPRGGLPVSRFLDLAIPLADAIASAHAKGIIHRDLKPSNIMVDRSGWLKVLDFGLARLRRTGDAESGLSTLPTKELQEPLTGEGKVVGTTAYMSPEQADGGAIDHRSDIFSLGIVLYEMATGICPFSRDTSLSTISSILRDTPKSITELNRFLPRDLGRIVMRCLAKDPERRFQTTLDLRNELEELKREVDLGDLTRLEVVNPARFHWTPARALQVAGLIVLVVFSTVIFTRWRGWFGLGGESGPPAVQLTRLTRGPVAENQPTISPDGRLVAFAGQVDTGKTDIFLQRVEGEKAINLTNDGSFYDAEPAFSPDGSRIAFRSEREGGGLFVMGATGESPKRVTDFGHYPSWSPDGTGLLFSRDPVWGPRLGPNESQIWTVDLNTGETRLIVDEEAAHPVWSPSRRRIAYWAVKGGQRDIWTMLPDGSDRQTVTRDAPTDWRPQWAPDGRYLYFISDRGGADNLWRIPLNEDSGRPLGSPEPVTTGASAVGIFAISGDGRRIVATMSTFQPRLEKFEFDPESETIVGDPTLVVPVLAAVPDLSPDGQWITYMSFEGQEDIFVIKTDGTSLRQLTDDHYRDRAPSWSPSGDRIAFFSNRSGKYEIWTIRLDGIGLRQETETSRDLLGPAWSPDGSRMSCTDRRGGNFILEVRTEDAGPRGLAEMLSLPPLEEDGVFFAACSWSADGDRIAGDVSNSNGEAVGIALWSLETGRYTSVIRFSPEPSSACPTWLPDGRRLIYSRGEKLFVTDSRTGEERLVTTPKTAEGERVFYFPAAEERSLLRGSILVNQDLWLIDLQP